MCNARALEATTPPPPPSAGPTNFLKLWEKSDSHSIRSFSNFGQKKELRSSREWAWELKSSAGADRVYSQKHAASLQWTEISPPPSRPSHPNLLLKGHMRFNIRRHNPLHLPDTLSHHWDKLNETKSYVGHRQFLTCWLTRRYKRQTFGSFV